MASLRLYLNLCSKHLKCVGAYRFLSSSSADTNSSFFKLPAEDKAQVRFLFLNVHKTVEAGSRRVSDESGWSLTAHLILKIRARDAVLQKF